ncbi:MAG: M1 family aminopeptidase [Caldilineaceae bacterium]|nr:M1 family aminopeptidase [Caldilineaceae bacterium]
MLKRVISSSHRIPKWAVRSIVAVVTVLACGVLETAPWRESGVAAPAVAQVSPVSTRVASLPTPTPTLVVVATKRPTPVPVDDMPAKDVAVVEQEPVGFPPLSTYSESLRPEFQSILPNLSHLTRYDMSVEIFPARRMLKGTAVIALRNNSAMVWPSIVFRLPANHPRLNTDMQLERVVVDGLSVQPVLSPSATVATIPLASPLQPGNWARVEFTWFLGYEHLSDEGAYVRNGANQDMINLPHFYPELAVHAPGAPGTDAMGWWIQEIPQHTDIRFHETVLMTVEAVAPSEYVLVGSGAPVHEETVAHGRKRQQWVTGPVRGFVLQASPLYRVSSKNVDGIRIQSFYHAEDESVALRVLDQAAQALGFFSKTWIPYPYAHLNIVASPLAETAMEYSNLIQMGVMRYRSQPWNTAFLVVHEVAHQWIYLLVHNDPVNHPGLDEGLADLSYVYMMETVDQNFNGVRHLGYWQRLNEDFGSRFPGDSPWWLAHPYHDFRHYHATHYRRPAVLLGEIWAYTGHEAFTDKLRHYMGQYQFRITTPEHLIGVFQGSVPQERLTELEEAIGISAAPGS